MRQEYVRDELGKGTRGKYYQEYVKGSNLVLLSPDVAAAFPDEESVNETLRSLIELAKRSVSPTNRSTKRTRVRT